MPGDIPVATYRVQFTPAFGFDAAAALVPYLKALGVSHFYASPFTKARAGSTHGYDVIDHAALNPELGGEEGFARLAAALGTADIGLILDFVPNHMGVGGDNPWWLDVLEWGQQSPHAAAFDIDWDALPDRSRGAVLLPILDRPYGDALEQGRIALRYDRNEGSFSAWYADYRLPICPNRYGDILRTAVAAAGAADTPPGRHLLELAELHRGPHEPARDAAPAFKAALAAVAGGADVIDRGLVAYRPDGERSRALVLHRLLERQHYRVAGWRIAYSEINYRRFFDIADLAGIRVEHPATFVAVHALVARLIAADRLHGLRLDHIDGLSDPQQYCRRLQRLIRASRHGAAGRRPFYVVAEKILGEAEPMPPLPGIAGTTGYETTNAIARTLLDNAGLTTLDRLAVEITGTSRDFAAILAASKVDVLETMFVSELSALARIAAGDWHTRDYTGERLRAALRLFILNFPVYRTYVTADGASPQDRATIAQAIAAARRRWVGADVEIFDFLSDVLTLDVLRRPGASHSRRRVRHFVQKLQQFTGPMMAKSLEDTALYRHVRLIALNEVGGDPALPGLSIAEFHRRMAARAAASPHAMSATATHDTKRGEDARMRILALAELCADWAQGVRRWRRLNESFVRRTERCAPSAAHEYFMYQALVGAWPLATIDADFIARVVDYAIKAAREGKTETSWMNPDRGYEDALTRFVHGILGSIPFVRDFDALARRAALIGALNSLSQLALKATIPGVPDFYQGTELWDLSLVDPDNRGAVDFTARARVLAETAVADWDALAVRWPDGHIKLALTHRLLSLRNAAADLFREGRYLPIKVKGADARHVIAFARVLKDRAVVVAAGRHFAAATEGGRRWMAAGNWDATLDLGEFEIIGDALRSGARPAAPAAAHLLQGMPIAILHARRR